jgi:NAD(P)H-dependent FMN reductase
MSLNIAVIYGSVRTARKGIGAARFVVSQLEQRGHSVTLVDPLEYQLPFLDRMHKEYDPGTAPEAMEAVHQIFEKADGFVVVSAEYNHSEPAALKNLLDHYQSEYLYKPTGIVTYSAGPFGGVRSLITLRAILAELGTPSIPSAFPISKIGSAFDENGNALDDAYERRIGKFLTEFEWYARALRAARVERLCQEASPAQQEMCRGLS